MELVLRFLLLPLLYLLSDYNPELEELDFEFANSNQSKKKGPVPVIRDQLLSTTLSMDPTVASQGSTAMAPRREGLEE